MTFPPDFSLIPVQGTRGQIYRKRECCQTLIYKGSNPCRSYVVYHNYIILETVTDHTRDEAISHIVPMTRSGNLIVHHGWRKF